MATRRKRNQEPKPLSYVERTCLNQIQKIMDKHSGATLEEIKRELKGAYPFAERKGQRYKVWNRLVNDSLSVYQKTS